jgi:hypothetical protein
MSKDGVLLEAGLPWLYCRDQDRISEPTSIAENRPLAMIPTIAGTMGPADVPCNNTAAKLPSAGTEVFLKRRFWALRN